MPRHLIEFDIANKAVSPPSPCIDICEMDTSNNLCKGCLRDIDEITGWGRASDTEKRQIWQRIQQRRAILSRE